MQAIHSSVDCAYHARIKRPDDMLHSERRPLALADWQTDELYAVGLDGTGLEKVSGNVPTGGAVLEVQAH